MCWANFLTFRVEYLDVQPDETQLWLKMCYRSYSRGKEAGGVTRLSLLAAAGW